MDLKVTERVPFKKKGKEILGHLQNRYYSVKFLTLKL